MVERFESEEAANRRVEELNKEEEFAAKTYRHSFCPLIRAFCRSDCVALAAAYKRNIITSDDSKRYDVYPRYCESPVITGAIHTERY